MTSCNTIGVTFALGDVYGVSNPNLTLITPLITECTSLDPLERFNQYCLIPTAASLGSSCDVTQRPEQDWIFAKMQEGSLTTLEELPLLFSSAPAVADSKEEWVEGITPDSFDFLSLATSMNVKMSNNATYLIALNTADETGYMAATDGIWYPIIKGTSPRHHTFFDMAGNGETRVIGNSTEYFWFGVADNSWHTGPTVQGSVILAIRVWTSAFPLLAVVSRSNTSVYLDVFQGSTFSTHTLSTTIPATSTASNYEYAAIALDTFPPQLNFFIVLGSKALKQLYVTWSAYNGPVNSWFKNVDISMANVDTTPVDPAASATMRGTAGVSSNFNMLCFIPGFGLFEVTLPNNLVDPAVVDDYFNTVYWGVTSSQGNQFQTFMDRQDVPVLYVYNNGVRHNVRPDIGTGLFLNPDSAFSFGVDPTGSILCLSYENSIYTNTPTVTDGTAWSVDNSFSIYSSTSVSDIGTDALNVNDYNPGPQWFMGSFRNITTAPAYFGSATNGTYYSLHQRYRVTTVVSQGITSMLPAATANIQTPAVLARSNEVAMIQDASHETRIYDDGNVKVIVTGNDTQVVWENNMHDRLGVITSFTVVSRTRPTLSPNGQYIVWWASDGTFRESFYAFNNKLFRDYGLTNDTIFANSLTSQSNYCYDNLQLDPDNPFNIKFSDGRCTCIGGEVLFNRVFTNTDLLPPAQRALLLETYACMMIDCTGTRVNFEPTNTFRKMEGDCLFPITICSNIIRAEGSAAVGTVNINQNCGGTGINCAIDADCSIGEACQGGFCMQTCVDASDCKTVGGTVFDCISGICTEGSNVAGSGSLSAGAIAGIVVAVVVVLVVTAVLLWYFLTHKRGAKA